jgi:cyanophycin synthetase
LKDTPYLLKDETTSNANIQIGWGINQQNTNELLKSIYRNQSVKNNGRIPIISVTGTNGKTTTTTLCAFILRGVYKNVGKTTTNGVYINDNKIESGDCAGSQCAEKLLTNSCIDACSFETALGGIHSGGLAYDCANVGILTNIGKGDHMSPSSYSKSVEDLINVKMTVINYILPNGYAVVNANDEHLEDILTKLIHKNVFLFSVSKQNSYITQSIKQGKPVIYYESPNIIYLYQKQVIFNTKVIPILQDAPTFQIENVMASIAAAFVLNIPENIIKKQLSLYENTCVNNPGRMNRIKYGSTDIIIDYAHNTDSIDNICNYVSSVKDKYKKKIIMFGAAGDRDETIIKYMTTTLYKTFDIVNLFVDNNTLRGKTSNELMGLMKVGISNSSTQCSSTNVVKYHYSERNAINDSFKITTKNSGDLLILLVDDVDNSIKYIMKKFIEL